MNDKLVSATKGEIEPSVPASNAPMRVPDPTESDDLDIGGLIPDWAKSRYPEASPAKDEQVDFNDLSADVIASPEPPSPH